MQRKIEITEQLNILKKKLDSDREKIQNINPKNPSPRDGVYTFISAINANIKARGLDK